MRLIQDFKVYSAYANPLMVLFFSKGFHSLVAYRLGHFLAKAKILTPISFLLSRIIQILYGVDLHWQAQIGGGLRILHGYSAVIGANVIIGQNCTLYHEVTIGSKQEWSGAGMPVIGDNVKIYAGAKVLGKIKIAHNVTIGANAVVTKSLTEAGAIYGGIPAKKIKK